MMFIMLMLIMMIMTRMMTMTTTQDDKPHTSTAKGKQPGFACNHKIQSTPKSVLNQYRQYDLEVRMAFLKTIKALQVCTKIDTYILLKTCNENM